MDKKKNPTAKREAPQPKAAETRWTCRTAPKERQQTILVVGRSGSGKSFLIKRIAKNLKRDVVVLNDNTLEPDFNRIDWADLPLLVGKCLVVEDLIGIDRHQVAILKRLLNWSNHHAQVPLTYYYYYYYVARIKKVLALAQYPTSDRLFCR